jgi:hypothetical protein
MLGLGTWTFFNCFARTCDADVHGVDVNFVGQMLPMSSSRRPTYSQSCKKSIEIRQILAVSSNSDVFFCV